MEDDVGTEIAESVARWLVMFLRRPGGQSQFAAPVWRARAQAAPVRRAQDLIETSPGADHRVGVLASTVAMSERHFLRRFTAETGMTPAAYVEEIRVERARQLLEESADPVELVSARCGFGTPETMRRAFSRRVGAAPAQYRSRFRRIPETAPSAH